MEFLATIKAQIPDYAKDIRLNLDGVIARSSLAPEDALGVALAAAFAARSKPLIDAFRAAAVNAAFASGAGSAALNASTSGLLFAAKAAASATPTASSGARLERAIAPSRLRRMSFA